MTAQRGPQARRKVNTDWWSSVERFALEIRPLAFTYSSLYFKFKPLNSARSLLASAPPAETEITERQVNPNRILRYVE